MFDCRLLVPLDRSDRELTRDGSRHSNCLLMKLAPKGLPLLRQRAESSLKLRGHEAPATHLPSESAGDVSRIRGAIKQLGQSAEISTDN